MSYFSTRMRVGPSNGDDGIDVAKTVSGKFDVKSIIDNTIGGKN